VKRPSGTEALKRTRRLRRDSTDAEKKLWSILRNRHLDGVKFRRQVAVGAYVADFLCLEARLIVELDGGQHDAQAGYDARRTRALEAEGYRVIRFWNDDVLANLEGVAEVLRTALRYPSPSQPAAGPLPLPRGEGI